MALNIIFYLFLFIEPCHPKFTLVNTRCAYHQPICMFITKIGRLAEEQSNTWPHYCLVICYNLFKCFQPPYFLNPILSLIFITSTKYVAISSSFSMSFPSLNCLYAGQIMTWDWVSIDRLQLSQTHRSFENLGSLE